MLKILGEKHRLYDFLSTLSVKSSYLLFNKEHVKELLLEADVQKSTGNTQYALSCMNILVVKNPFFLHLFLMNNGHPHRILSLFLLHFRCIAVGPAAPFFKCVNSVLVISNRRNSSGITKHGTTVLDSVLKEKRISRSK